MFCVCLYPSSDLDLLWWSALSSNLSGNSAVEVQIHEQEEHVPMSSSSHLYMSKDDLHRLVRFLHRTQKEAVLDLCGSHKRAGRVSVLIRILDSQFRYLHRFCESSCRMGGYHFKGTLRVSLVVAQG